MKIIIECTPNEGGTLVELLTKILRECPYCDEIDITRCGESCPPAPETVVEELDRGMTE